MWNIFIIKNREKCKNTVKRSTFGSLVFFVIVAGGQGFPDSVVGITPSSAQWVIWEIGVWGHARQAPLSLSWFPIFALFQHFPTINLHLVISQFHKQFKVLLFSISCFLNKNKTYFMLFYLCISFSIFSY